MMDFLRSLAPSRATAPSRAVGVVPSRFEGGRPLSPAAAPMGSAWSVDVGPSEDALPPPVKADRPISRVPPAETRRHTTSDQSVHLEAAEAGRAASPIARPQPVRVDVAAPLTRTHAQERTPSHPTSQSAEPVPAARPDNAAPLRSPAAAVREPVTTRGQRHADGGPLSTRAIEIRSASPYGQLPPVVHVTIDRIDVRAPAVADRPSPRPRPRPRASSSGSLTDYLRSRHGGPRGGGS
jgi:hypothetical protein